MVVSALKVNKIKKDPEQAQWKGNLTIPEGYFRERSFSYHCAVFEALDKIFRLENFIWPLPQNAYR